VSFFCGNHAYLRLKTDHQFSSLQAIYGDNRACVFELVGSLCTIVTILSPGTQHWKNFNHLCSTFVQNQIHYCHVRYGHVCDCWIRGVHQNLGNGNGKIGDCSRRSHGNMDPGVERLNHDRDLRANCCFVQTHQQQTVGSRGVFPLLRVSWYRRQSWYQQHSS
jgi:hypothetical protein